SHDTALCARRLCGCAPSPLVQLPAMPPGPGYAAAAASDRHAERYLDRDRLQLIPPVRGHLSGLTILLDDVKRFRASASDQLCGLAERTATGLSLSLQPTRDRLSGVREGIAPSAADGYTARKREYRDREPSLRVGCRQNRVPSALSLHRSHPN